MEDIQFSSIKELYERLKPALECKESEIKKMGFSYIKKEDILNALKNQKWNKSSNLTLYEMVDDILNSSPSYFDDYIKKVFNETKRNINLKEEDIL